MSLFHHRSARRSRCCLHTEAGREARVGPEAGDWEDASRGCRVQDGAARKTAPAPRTQPQAHPRAQQIQNGQPQRRVPGPAQRTLLTRRYGGGIGERREHNLVHYRLKREIRSSGDRLLLCPPTGPGLTRGWVRDEALDRAQITTTAGAPRPISVTPMDPCTVRVPKRHKESIFFLYLAKAGKNRTAVVAGGGQDRRAWLSSHELNLQPTRRCFQYRIYTDDYKHKMAIIVTYSCSPISLLLHILRFPSNGGLWELFYRKTLSRFYSIIYCILQFVAFKRKLYHITIDDCTF